MKLLILGAAFLCVLALLSALGQQAAVTPNTVHDPDPNVIVIDGNDPYLGLRAQGFAVIAVFLAIGVFATRGKWAGSSGSSVSSALFAVVVLFGSLWLLSYLFHSGQTGGIAEALWRSTGP